MLSFYLLCLCLCTAYGALLYADHGQNVTLECFFTSSAKYLSWYKQMAGGQPQIISSIYTHIPDVNSFHNQFKATKRFSVQTGRGFYHLTISYVQSSDSAMYYCGQTSITITEFYEGIFLVLRDSRNTSFILQPASDSVKPGGSVTLNCTVHTGTCDGEHSVYWFRNSEEAHPGLIYTHGGRNDQCERNPHSHTHTCVYNLAMRSLNLSHAGTYYCAVVSCGHILFGNGTRLEIKDEGKLMSGALACTTILAVLLTFALCMMKKRNSSQSNKLKPGAAVPSTMTAEGYQTKLNLYYAALGANLTDRSRPQRDQTWSECVYYSVKK
ncbi:uncharacterized protein LOC121504693 [Cheilinus undulatus]|uniref:uncharacterized protein LOC121504693 n=1 Tax=Cheilinus undulatus TaxID=241271 RepID=UPI001BD6068B|nr:uncharacterized protein LOC121504693 [Cheilinus undulatus]